MVISSFALGQMKSKKGDHSLSKSSVEETLIRIESNWAKAAITRDTAALNRILASDHIYTCAGGNTISKAEFLAGLKSVSQKAGFSYGLGVALGHGSFFASRGSSNQVAALENIKKHVVALQNQGISISLDTANNIRFREWVPALGKYIPLTREEIHNRFAAARGAYRDTIYSNSRYGPVYDFGVLVGLAEGQASVTNDAAATSLAKDALRQARDIASELKDYGISPSDVPVTPNYNTILKLRKEWQKLFSQSAGF
jgi:hypothetical protein